MEKTMSNIKSKKGLSISAVILGLIALFMLWIMRATPLVHGTVMMVWGSYPLILVPALLMLPCAFIMWRTFKNFNSSRYDRFSDRQLIAMWTSGLLGIVAIVVFLVGYTTLQDKAVSDYAKYADIKELPSTKSVRVIPADVMDRMAQDGYSETRTALNNGHMVASNGKLIMTHEVAQNGYFRSRAHSTEGIATQDTTSTDRTLKSHKASQPFETAPSNNAWFFDIPNWNRKLMQKALKEHYLVDLKESVGVIASNGNQMIVTPYNVYKGFFVRYQVPGGVFVTHPDGKMEDLTIEEARKRPDIVSSGRLYSEDFVRNVHENVRYRTGLLNGKFGKADVYHIDDSEALGNKQPYLTILEDGRVVWMTVLVPKGKQSATGGLLITDTKTGVTEMWKAPKGSTLTGGQRALEVVKSAPIAGITWGNGNYKAVEPRPVIVDGQLMFIISIVPSNNSGVARSVLFDAARSKVVKSFDHTEGNGDAELNQVLAAGSLETETVLDSSDESTDSDEPKDSTESNVKTPDLEDASDQELLEALIENNQEQMKNLQQQQKVLQEMLDK